MLRRGRAKVRAERVKDKQLIKCSKLVQGRSKRKAAEQLEDS